MFDDPGDIDRNGIPDAIQSDPVIDPGDPAAFSMVASVSALPGIGVPHEVSADAPAQPTPEPPVPPTPPAADAGEAAMADYERAMVEYQEALQRFSLLTQTLSNVTDMRHEMARSVANNLRG